jgi:hypothetical protein
MCPARRKAATILDGQVIQFAMDIPGIDKALADLGL